MHIRIWNKDRGDAENFMYSSKFPFAEFRRKVRKISNILETMRANDIILGTVFVSLTCSSARPRVHSYNGSTAQILDKFRSQFYDNIHDSRL